MYILRWHGGIWGDTCIQMEVRVPRRWRLHLARCYLWVPGFPPAAIHGKVVEHLVAQHLRSQSPLQYSAYSLPLQ